LYNLIKTYKLQIRIVREQHIERKVKTYMSRIYIESNSFHFEGRVPQQN